MRGHAFRLAAAMLLLAIAETALASSGGISGVSNNPAATHDADFDNTNNGTNCTYCHSGGSFGGSPSLSTTTVAPGVANAMTLSLSGSSASSAGFNLSINTGTLTAGGNNQTIDASLGGNLELTHVNRNSTSWSFTYTPPSTVGTQTMYICINQVNADSGTGGDQPTCSTPTITINTTPAAVGDTPTVTEDTATTLNLMSNDTSGASANESGDSKEITHINGTLVTSVCPTTVAVTNGTVCRTSSAANNQLTFTPSSNNTTGSSFTYRITDSLGAISGNATVTVGITAVNDAPVLVTPASISVTEDVASALTGISVSDVDASTSSLTYTLTVGSGTLNSPSCTGVTVGGTSTARTLTGSATNLNNCISGSNLTFTTASNSTSTVSLGVSISDNGNTGSGGAQSDSATVSLTVTAVNDAPVAVNDTATVDEDSSLNLLTVLANDTDVDSGDTKTVTLVNGGAVSVCPTMTAVTNGSVCKSSSSANNTLSFTPTAAFVGAASFTYTMRDTAAATSTATVNITVANVGDPPVAVDDTTTVNEDTTGNVIDVLANDTDPDAGDTKTVTQVNGATVATCPSTTAVTNGTVCRSSTSPNNTLSFAPAANFEGGVSFSYTVQDASALTDNTGLVSITVVNVNDAPVAVADSQTIAEDAAPVTLSVLANDTDVDNGDTKTITLVNGAAVATCASVTALSNGTICKSSASANNTLSFDSAADFFGVQTFTYTMRDAAGLTSAASVTVTVTAVNDAPQITSTAQTAAADGVPYSYQVTVTDPDDVNDGSQLAWSLPTAPAGMTVSATGLVEWTPPIDVAGAYSVTVQVADGGENGAAAATQSFTINVSVPDSDGDGMPDSFEDLYGFDKDNPVDAGEDADGDGRSNLEEYQQDSDPTLDDVAPLVVAPADLVVDATGYLTVVDIGVAEATDGLDGVLTATVEPAVEPLRPGRHVYTWSATDASGNVNTDTQTVDVLPLVELNVDQSVGDGASAQVTVTLSGTAPAYPVLIAYSVGGSATPDDSNAPADGTFTINEGESSATVVVDIAVDGPGEPAETVVFTLGAATNAVLGARQSHTITIVDANVAPRAVLSTVQDVPALGIVPRLVVYRDDGFVTITAEALDGNAGQTPTFDWTGSSNALGIDSTPATSNEATFDPAALLGAYPVSVTVSDGAGGQGTATLLVVVLAGSSDDVDVDADGIPDAVDPATDYPAVLPDQTGDASQSQLLETDSTLRLRLGRTALAAGRAGALVTANDLVLVGVGEGGLPLTGADSYENAGGIFDFEIHGVAIGGSARVVVPLQTSVRPGAVYRKFDPAAGWHDFVADAGNAIASAHSLLGQCPGLDSGEYVDGLQPFTECVRLTLTDGGPNDADGVADGVIRDPGGVAVAAATDDETVAVSGGAFLAFWLPLAALLRLRRRAGLALLALGALLAAAPARAEHHVRIHYGGDVASGFDSNVTNAQQDADIRESGFTSATGSVDYQRSLSLYTTLLLRGSAQGEYWNSFDGLNNGKGTAMARLLYRADGDFWTPTFAGWVSAALMEFDSAIRDSNEYRAGVFVTENLTTQITGRFALGASRREADGLVYDLSGYSASLNFDWAPAARTVVYAGYQYYVGDVASTASATSFWIVDAAEAIEADDAFGGLAGGLLAYRLDARAQIATLGFNYAFSRKLSADVQGQYISTRATERIDYERMVGVVSLLARF